MSLDRNGDDTTRTHIQLTHDTVIGHYRIIDKIGAGGMGEVYLAEDTELNRKVALKFLPPHLCQDADCRARFKREAQAAAKLNHPNIVTIHEVSEFNGLPYIAMEHLEGQSLRELIAQKNFSLSRAIDIAIQLCEGLQEAHSRGIVHRDIKPSNITCDGKGRCKILDFGLAAVKGDKKLTKSGSTLGTLHYMSPEQTRGEEVDRRSDIFSLGVLLYEMITGQLPFKGDYDPAVLYAIGFTEPEPLARYKSGVPDELQRIVSKMLAKDVSRRHQTAADLIADLRSTRLEESDRKRSRSGLLAVAAAVSVVAVVSYFVVAEFTRTAHSAPQGWSNSVAVLVFRDLSPARDQEYFCEGMTDEIISRLSAIRQLKVTSVQSVLGFRGSDLNLKEIGRKLGVENILEGSIQKDRDSIRISAQLIRVNDDAHIWSDRYYHQAGGVFDIQNDIARSITQVLEATLVGAKEVTALPRGTSNLEAYNEYALGRFLWRKRTEKDLRAAIKHFENAIALDPFYAQAYSGIGDSWVSLPNYGKVNHADVLPVVDSASRKAIALDDNCAEAHATRGNYLRNIGDYPGADKEFRRALELNPGYSWAHVWYDLLLTSEGEKEEAARHLQTAYELDPLSVVVLNNLAARSMDSGDTARIERYCRQVLAIEPDYTFVYDYLVPLYINLKHDTARGFSLIDTLIGRHPDDPSSWDLQADWLAAVGRNDEALKSYLKGVEIAPDFWEPHWQLGNFYLDRGQLQDAITELKRSIDLGAGVANPFIDCGRALVLAGRAEEALDINRKAVTLSPYDAESNRAYGWLLGRYLGKYDDAIRYITRAIELNPRLNTAYNSLSFMYTYKEDFPRALEAINKSIELVPADPFPLQRKALIFTCAGMLDSAVFWYQQYQSRAPNQTTSAIQLQRIYTITGQYAKADSAIGSLLTSSDPRRQSLGRYYSVNSLLHQGRFREGLSASQKDIELDTTGSKDYATVRLELLRQCETLLLFLHDFAAASEVVEQYGKLLKPYQNPTAWDSATHIALRAVAQACTGSIDSATKTLQEELDRAAPENNTLVTSLQYHLALVRRLAGDYSQSAQLLEKIVAVDPAFSYRLYLGVCYLHLGRVQDAVSVLETAMSRYDDNRLWSVPESVAGHYYLGQAYEAAGRTQEAIAQYTTFLGIWKNADPGLKQVEDARASLRRLKGII